MLGNYLSNFSLFLESSALFVFLLMQNSDDVKNI
jgi:hypothetical protein